jgi:hypothetical protein
MNFSLRRIPDVALAVVAISLCAMGALAQPLGTRIAKPQPSGTPVAPPAPAPASEWQSFLSPDKKFAVLMPTAPLHREKKAQNGITVHAYTSTHSNKSFSVSYFEVGDEATAKTALDLMPNVIANAGQATISNLRNITLQNNEGREFDLAGQQSGVTYKAKMRLYAVGKRIYTISSNCAAQDCKKFFDSFKLN